MIIWTIKEAAKYLKVNPATIRRSLVNHQLPGRKVGRSWRLVKEDIDNYLAGQVQVVYTKLSTGEEFRSKRNTVLPS